MSINNAVREEFSFLQSNSLDISIGLMLIGMIGINHKSADVGLREQFAKACQRRFGPSCSAHPGLSYVLLSTCNRCEVYFSSEDLAEVHTYFLGILRGDISEEFDHCVYSYFGVDCFFHLARVTAGMDSAILWETEIQGQVKQAYEAAARYQLLSKEIHFLFQKSLKIGKEIRLSSSHGSPALEDAILSAALYLQGDLQDKRILFVGLSEINYKIFLSFKQRKLKNLTICNRTNNRALEFCKKEQANFLPWDSLMSWPRYDIAIFGTKSPEYLISQNTLHETIDSSKLLIDLCVPRNIDPGLSKHPHVTLLNIDQLHRKIGRKKERLKTAEHARLELQDIASIVSKQIAIFHAKESFRQGTLLSEVS